MDQPSSECPLLRATNQQIAEKTFEEIDAPSIELIVQENASLANTAALIDDAISSPGGFSNYMSVWSVTNALTDAREVEKLMTSVPPSSKFHNNSWAPKELLDGLNRWLREQVISNQDSMLKASDILSARHEENRAMLRS